MNAITFNEVPDYIWGYKMNKKKNNLIDKIENDVVSKLNEGN